MHNGVNWRQAIDLRSADGENSELLKPCYGKRGFLPEQDPLTEFPADSPYTLLDDIGRELPSLLHDKHFRSYARALNIPPWQGLAKHDTLPVLRLYYLRVGFLASAYINQLGQESCHILPSNISAPLVRVCKLLQRPPILSYDAYALYNWRRFDAELEITLGNIDTLQNFVDLYDEHWFILVHVEIEAIAAEILAAIKRIYQARHDLKKYDIGGDLKCIARALKRQIKVLQRIPEKMDPALYFKTFRPYIRFFENVAYQGVAQQTTNFRGETGAQSSIIPVLVTLLKIPHQSSILTEHLADMRNYMPYRHRVYLNQLAELPNLRRPEYKESFNAILDLLIEFRRVHYHWAYEYIHQRVNDPKGTGGTPYMQWLQQLITETEAHKL